LAHIVEAPQGFLLGMVLDAEEFGADVGGAESPMQFVRLLHDTLGTYEVRWGV
jgi:hypothetical protein